QSPNGNNTLYAGHGGVKLLIRPAGVYADDPRTGTPTAIVQRRTASNLHHWVYWALVRQGATLTIYRDGTAVGSATLDKPDVPSTLNGNIGATNATYHLHGHVDEVAVYKHALTPETLLLHYHMAGYG
ncbi:MAG TPA: LamG-like jellyroll fold domain-containing protein, partial [Solirubrobacteraceae bacterium]